MERKTPIYQKSHLNYSKLLQLAKGWSNFVSYRSIIWRLLKNRGVQDILFFCIDGLSGFKEIIDAMFPQAQIQRYVIHMLHNSFKYTNYSDLKKFPSVFKAVYNAPNEKTSIDVLTDIYDKWGRKCPYAINNWKDVSSFSSLMRSGA